MVQKAPWRNFPTGKGVAPLHRDRDERGEEGAHTRQRARIILLLYAQFQQSCMRNRTHSLSHFSFPSRKFVADPLNREILQSSVKRKGSNCGENCEGSSAENCYRGIATPYHLPCILKYRHRFAARVRLLHTTNENFPQMWVQILQCKVSK